MLEGDITYVNQGQGAERGSAQQIAEGCEEVKTVSTTALTALEAPAPCVTLSICPPAFLGSEELRAIDP